MIPTEGVRGALLSSSLMAIWALALDAATLFSVLPSSNSAELEGAGGGVVVVAAAVISLEVLEGALNGNQHCIDPIDIDELLLTRATEWCYVSYTWSFRRRNGSERGVCQKQRIIALRRQNS
jgi:hypothetical protein